MQAGLPGPFKPLFCLSFSLCLPPSHPLFLPHLSLSLHFSFHLSLPSLLMLSKHSFILCKRDIHPSLSSHLPLISNLFFPLYSLLYISIPLAPRHSLSIDSLLPLSTYTYIVSTRYISKSYLPACFLVWLSLNFVDFLTKMLIFTILLGGSWWQDLKYELLHAQIKEFLSHQQLVLQHLDSNYSFNSIGNECNGWWCYIGC